MKDTITQIGLVILGVFIAVTLVLGTTGSMKSTMTSGVSTKLTTDVKKVLDNTTNP